MPKCPQRWKVTVEWVTIMANTLDSHNTVHKEALRLRDTAL
ncbi:MULTISPECIES: hypothetical protein [unclassified Pseudoalteromonas]|nr:MULTISPECIES: hypothetical protein [unclassified Pseudoalteromonas]